jgi:hypothetical protein
MVLKAEPWMQILDEGQQPPGSGSDQVLLPSWIYCLPRRGRLSIIVGAHRFLDPRDSTSQVQGAPPRAGRARSSM